MTSDKFQALIDRLGELGKVLSSIQAAMQNAKQMRQNDSELGKVMEEAKQIAVSIGELQIPERQELSEVKRLAQALKEASRDMSDSLSKLEVYVQLFNKEMRGINDSDQIQDFDNSALLENMTTALSKVLDKLFRSTLDLHKTLNLFLSHYENVKKLVDQLQRENLLLIRQLSGEHRLATGLQNVSIICACCWLLVAAVIIFLSYFWPSETVSTKNILGVTIAAIVILSTYVITASSSYDKSQLLSYLVCEHKKLDGSKLQSKALFGPKSDINIDEAAENSLEIVLKHFQKEHLRDKNLAESETKLAEKDAQLTAMKSEVSELRAKLQALGSYTSAAASLTTMHSVEHFRGALQQRPQLEAARGNRRHHGGPNRNFYNDEQEDEVVIPASSSRRGHIRGGQGFYGN